MNDGESGLDDQLRRQIEAHVDKLPVLPIAVARLMALTPGADDFFESVLSLVEGEPNLAVRVLRAANSATSSPAAPITSLGAAISRIGARGASDLILALSVAQVFVPREPWEKALWRHGIQVANAARELARRGTDPRVRPEDAYACALLHDVGRFVLFQEAPEKLRLIDEGDWDTPQALVEQELAICGVTHPEIGAMACAKWGLPSVIEEVVRWHHDPEPKSSSEVAALLSSVVRVADVAMFPSVMPGTPGLEQEDPDELERLLGPRLPSFVKLSALELREVVATASAEAEVTCEALGLG